MLKRTSALLIALLITLTCAVSVSAATTVNETAIQLSDNGVSVNGKSASTDPASAVYTGADIVYYEAGHDSTYGEGKASDEHTAKEAAAHTVVTITQPGTYRVSGKLSVGQLAIDLGDGAAKDPKAVVVLILDGADITCTVAPAVIFYNVYEPYSASEDTKGVTDLSSAGAQVVLADGSANKVTGSYVARIYKEGTTKKLHKYDGAFYSKMSLNISGESSGTGELRIQAANEGLDSELHLTINGGKIEIQSQDDGINTNEDGISVTTINGGYLKVNAGLGSEGDGIDSNGYLTINGGTVVTMANERSPDGGIDADKDIALNGGTVVALGTRNDATGSNSKQTFIELAFASTQPAGSVIKLTDASGKALLTHTAEKAFQSLTFTSADLALNTEYHVYINDGQQQYTGNSFGMMGGPGGRPNNGQAPGEAPPAGGPAPGQAPPAGNERPTDRPEGMPAFPDGFNPLNQQENDVNTVGSIAFVITDKIHSFSGVSDSADATGKTRVSFTVNNGKGIANATSGNKPLLTSITANAKVPEQDIQITVTDIPSESYSETRLLSEVKDSLSDLMPDSDGTYRLTAAVVSTNTEYAGVSQWQFTIGGLPFTDVSPTDGAYDAIKALYDKGIMNGTGTTSFSPNATVNRATAITALGRLLGVETADTDRFPDVKQGSWYGGYVGWAVANGIVQGDNNGQFRPNDNLAAAHMQLILDRYANLIGKESITLNSAGSLLTRGELAIVLASLL
ncbi:carbohydrate-binding domain-containing protein [Cohnella herbarum]|uniref:Carbohydrate-binding domain-containing protein n=1 Tax=Cohnella herbarum TaxID=2728023 RepID=A0A7Z2VN42_9BACL|nr:carbohydrate-binding domain-containing protein [Cohnella herbarum]QJD85964.1 carbohydrate-binding domain-containing protein [Cohnella herbarum]